MPQFRLLGGTTVALALVVTAASAAAQDASTLATGGAIALPPIVVTAPPTGLVNPTGISPGIGKFALPQTIESIDQQQIEATTNIVDAEDALKYLPSLLVRKRNYGDTQPTLATRTWGINSSARNLVYVDDVPISALISNNNTTGAPRWGLVAPEQISGVDMLYGPFAAEYPGNSMGGVVLFTTRMPDSLEVTGKQTGAVQNFNYYNTRGTYGTSNSAATIGDRSGRLSWFLSVNREENNSQPLGFVTNGSVPAGTTGTILALNKTGGVADVVGAGGLLHTVMDNASGRFALDLTDWLRATWSVGFWDNDTRSRVQTYLTGATGLPTFGGVNGFASNNFTLTEDHLANALSLKTDTKGNWDWEAIATRYDYLTDLQRSPAGVAAGTTFTAKGFVTRLDGTGWDTQDVKGIWRPSGTEGDHELSFGGHRDRYTLNNPTYNSDNWTTSPDNGNGTLSTEGKGNTETNALWVQDAWKFARSWKLTLGGRLEWWQAYDGFNLAGGIAAHQPTERSTNFSPKATLGWQIDPAWSTKLSFGEAYRYPTVAELYQIVATGPTFAVPNPNLTPENVYSGEFAVERNTGDSRLRLSFFQENTDNALISQTNQINNNFVTTFQNVDAIRNRGIEFVAEQRNVFIPGLEFSNSLTFVDSRICRTRPSRVLPARRRPASGCPTCRNGVTRCR